jgi:hypothetical protein
VSAGPRIVGVVLLAMAGFLSWKTHAFRPPAGIERYPRIQFAYDDCKYEKITHSRGATIRHIIFLTKQGRYVMEDEVWKDHFDGPTLAARFAGPGTVQGWLHPEYDHVLRGIEGGKVQIPLAWGLAYDRRNRTVGRWTVGAMVLIGIVLVLWRSRPVQIA